MDNINFDFQKNKAETNEQQQKQEGTAEKGSYSREYSEILSSAISPDNIYTFHDDALEKLIKIVDKIVGEYKNTHPDTRHSGKDLEDEALKEEGLQDIPSMLDVISKRKADVLELEELVGSRASLLPDVFVPPGHGEVVTGSGEGIKEKELKPRLITLLYILENDISLDLQDENEIQIVEGNVTDEMMRKHPYFRVSITPLDRIVYLCEEENNASFVFSKKELNNLGIQIETLDITNKGTFKDLIEEHPKKVGVRVVQSKLWRAHILDALTNEEFRQVKKHAPKQKSDFEAREIVPRKKDGWESASSLRNICKSNAKTIKKYVEQFRVVNPDWFEKQQTQGWAAEYYSPEFVKKIVEYFTAIPPKKDHWETARFLVGICRAGSNSIKKYADQFRVSNPGWFEYQKSMGPGGEHYSPELVRVIVEHFALTPLKKAGWESASSLGYIYKSNAKTIKKYVEQFRTGHPEWFEEQRNPPKTVEHYHPELVKKVFENFISNRKKDGWESAHSLGEVCVGGHARIKKYTEQFRIKHPQWFEEQRSGNGLVEHYDPELVKKIIEHFGKRKTSS